MNRLNAMLVLGVALCMSNWAGATNLIEKWGGSGSGFSIDQQHRIITITAPGEYKFQATDGEQLGQIDLIRVDEAVTGDVIIYIEAESDDDSPGAANIRRCNLSGSANTTIAELRITEDLGADGPTVAASAGVIDVGHDVLDDVQIFGDITGAVRLGALWGTLSCNSVGELTIVGTEPRDPHPYGSLHVASGYADTMSIQQDMNNLGIDGELTGSVVVAGNVQGGLQLGAVRSSGTVTVAGSCDNIETFGIMRGAITITGNLSGFHGWNAIKGSIAVGGDLEGDMYFCTLDECGRVEIAGDLAAWLYSTDGGLNGEIDIGGNVGATVGITMIDTLPFNGTISISGILEGVIEFPSDMYGIVVAGDWDGRLVVFGTLFGEIRILRSLWDEPGAVNSVYVHGYGSSASVAVDWDGFDTDEYWHDGARVAIKVFGGPTITLTGNSPEWRVYEITECLGDMDNNGDVNFDDVDGFVAAMVSLDDYGALYPGLRGSVLYHGDFYPPEEPDGVINFDDLDAFIDCVVAGGCPTSAGACGGEREGGRSPVQMAAALAGGVAPERHELLADIIADYATRQRTESDQAYWNAVWTALTD